MHLDSDNDSEEEEEEPIRKSTELLASMSSLNKSLLKRGIEKVDKVEETAVSEVLYKNVKVATKVEKEEKNATREQGASEDEK